MTTLCPWVLVNTMGQRLEKFFFFFPRERLGYGEKPLSHLWRNNIKHFRFFGDI